MGRTEEGRRGREEDDGWDHCISVLGMKKIGECKWRGCCITSCNYKLIYFYKWLKLQI
jgi:hypothetical protein